LAGEGVRDQAVMLFEGQQPLGERVEVAEVIGT